MKKTNRKSAPQGRGRPRSADRTELTEALIRRQDAIARGRQRQIDRIRETHVSGADVRRLDREARTLLEARFGRLPRDLAPQIVACRGDQVAVYRLVDAELRQALTEVADQFAQLARQDDGADMYRRPRLRPSRSLPSARARAANLATELQELKARIITGNGRPRS